MKFPLFYDNYFVPRGYAVVQVDLAGTNRSAGCADVGGASGVGMTTVQALWFRADPSEDAPEPDYQAFTQVDVLNVVRRLNGA